MKPRFTLRPINLHTRMSDLSGLTYPSRQLPMHRDHFGDRATVSALNDLVHVLEDCDRCSAKVLLHRITYTGVEFLCPTCLAHSKV